MIEDCRLKIEDLRFAFGRSVIKKIIKMKERSDSTFRHSSIVIR